MVQIAENLDESIKKADSRAKKTLENALAFLDSINKPHTIPEIGKERIRRAGEMDDVSRGVLEYLLAERPAGLTLLTEDGGALGDMPSGK